MTRSADDASPAREAFSAIYGQDEWSGGSGVGSRPAATEPYRRLLRLVLGSRDVRSVVDAGCGDWQSSKLVDWSGVSYLGLDVVPEVIAANRERYGSERVRFEVGDALHDALPAGDLLIVKDVLQHWPNADVQRFLAREPRRHRYTLIVNDVASVHWPGEVNQDITLGAWRTLDLERGPFQARPLWRGEYAVGEREWIKRILLLGPAWRCLVPASAALRARLRGAEALTAGS